MHSWKKIFDKLSETAEEEDIEQYEIIFCGHSLGGVVAALTYVQLKLNILNIKMKRKVKLFENDKRANIKWLCRWQY